MNLNDAQRDYARTLTPGFALVRSPYGQPVHIKIPDVTKSDNYSAEAARLISDDHIRAFMEVQRKRFGIADAPAEDWTGGIAASGRSITQGRFCTGGSCPTKQLSDVAWKQRAKNNGKLLAVLFKALENQKILSRSVCDFLPALTDLDEVGSGYRDML